MVSKKHLIAALIAFLVFAIFKYVYSYANGGTVITDKGIATNNIISNNINVYGNTTSYNFIATNSIKVRGEDIAKFCDVVVARDKNESADIYCLDNDCSDEIQKAIDMVAAKGGGVVCIRKGIYLIGKTIYINSSDIIIQGAGRSIWEGGGTILKLKDGVNSNVIKAGKKIYRVVIRDLTIDGNSKNNPNEGFCINMGAAQDCMIDNVEVIHCSYGGILFGDVPGQAAMINRIIDTDVRYAGKYCIRIGYYTSDNWIVDTYTEDCDVGISMDSDTGNIQNCHIYNCTIGIESRWASQITIADCQKIEHIGKYAIYIYSSPHYVEDGFNWTGRNRIIITGNNIYLYSLDSPGTYPAIYIEGDPTYGSGENIISNNVIAGNGSYAIETVNSHYNIIIGNIMRDGYYISAVNLNGDNTSIVDDNIT